MHKEKGRRLMLDIKKVVLFKVRVLPDPAPMVLFFTVIPALAELFINPSFVPLLSQLCTSIVPCQFAKLNT